MKPDEKPFYEITQDGRLDFGHPYLTILRQDEISGIERVVINSSDARAYMGSLRDLLEEKLHEPVYVQNGSKNPDHRGKIYEIFLPFPLTEIVKALETVEIEETNLSDWCKKRHEFEANPHKIFVFKPAKNTVKQIIPKTGKEICMISTNPHPDVIKALSDAGVELHTSEIVKIPQKSLPKKKSRIAAEIPSPASTRANWNILPPGQVLVRSETISMSAAYPQPSEDFALAVIEQLQTCGPELVTVSGGEETVVCTRNSNVIWACDIRQKELRDVFGLSVQIIEEPSNPKNILSEIFNQSRLKIFIFTNPHSSQSLLVTRDPEIREVLRHMGADIGL